MSRIGALAREPQAVALAVAAPLSLAYLIVAPPAGDLAAATYRSDLFARVGFTTWDTGWYAAHGYWLPSYSLLSPALGALLGVRVLLVCCALAACFLFAAIARRAFPPAPARVAAGVFALGFCVGMLSGRVPYDLGFALALGAVLALIAGRPAAALVLAARAALASPVAGAFLALAGLALAVGDALPAGAREPGRAHDRARAGSALSGDRSPVPEVRAGLTLCAAALIPVLALGLAYPNGGYEPFAASAFWPALAAVALFALLLPRGPLSERAHRALRVGAGLYALALIGAYVLRTPVGGNAARLGPLLAAPLLAGVLWEHRRALLAALALPLLYWQLVTPIHDAASIWGEPSTRASYYAPLLGELRRLDDGRATIVEVPMTASHWEAAYLPGHDGVRLARGWERQLDTRYAALFYRPTLTAAAYRAWLAENRVSYVALPDARLDSAGRAEGALIARGAPYLRLLWHSQHWRVYRFIG